MGGAWSSVVGGRYGKKGGMYSDPDKIRGLTRLLTEENKRLRDVNRDEHDIHKVDHLLKLVYVCEFLS